MARPVEYGLEYFPMDIDFFDDPKLIVIEEQFKAKGLIITIRILSMIYRNGYFIQWTNDMPLIVAKRVGCEVNGALVTELVRALIKCGFFNEAVFNTCQILTSGGIQKRWQRIIADCKRKAVIDPKHVVNSEQSHINTEETIPIPELMRQRRTKESITKQNKEDEERVFHPPPSNLKNIEELNKIFQERQQWIEMCCMSLNIEPDKLKQLMVEFLKHLKLSSELAKTEKDFATHFLNWSRKQLIPGANTSTSVRQIVNKKFPNKWTKEVEESFEKQGKLHEYHQHLRKLGWSPHYADYDKAKTTCLGWWQDSYARK